MSKWKLPDQKGTELWPQVTRPPLVVRFEGVPPGSDLAKQLFNLLQGQIHHFYMKAAQAYSLSEVEQVGLRQVTNDFRMSYHNNHGTETLSITASAALKNYALRQVQEDRWDWALVDVVLPSPPSGVGLDALAVMQSPAGDTILPLSTLPHRGAAQGGQNSGSTATTERMVFSPPETYDVTETVDRQQASFLIDLRPAAKVPIVTVDLYAGISSFAETIPVYTRGRIQGPGVDAGPGEYGTSDTPIRDLSDPWPPEEPITTIWQGTVPPDPAGVVFPEVVFNTTTKYWDFGDATVETKTFPGGEVTAYTIDTYIAGFFFPWFVFEVSSDPADWAAAGPTSASVLVLGAVFKGAPDVISRRLVRSVGVGSNSFSWKSQAFDNVRSDLGVRTVGAPTQFTLYERFGLTYLGTVAIDTRIGAISLSQP